MDRWEIINRRISVCLSFREPNLKIKCLKELLEKYGEDGMVYLSLGDVYSQQGEYDKALKMYRKAHQLFPLPKYKQLALRKIEETEQKITRPATASDNTLYIVNCTKKKIWDLDPHAPPFVPAIIAYQGSSFKEFLEYVNRKNIKWWLILSAKYGFIEPWHPIENYNVTFDNEETGPITDDTLRNQVLHQTRWNYTGNPRKLRDFQTVYVYAENDKYLEKVRKAFKNIAKVEKLQQLN